MARESAGKEKGELFTHQTSYKVNTREGFAISLSAIKGMLSDNEELISQCCKRDTEAKFKRPLCSGMTSTVENKGSQKTVSATCCVHV